MSDSELKKIKVVVVDDSTTMQRFIQQLVIDDQEIDIVAVASNPYEAREIIKQHNPNVLILDIEMPRMDGLTFLSNIMRLRPMPVVMNSSLSQKGAYETIKALELGAVDFIGKPQSAEAVPEYKIQLVRKIKRAAKVNVIHPYNDQHSSLTKIYKSDVLDSSPVTKLLAIGASTGGIEAITVVLRDIPENSPPILIVQHIPPNFSTAFAQRLNETCRMHVFEAEHSQKIRNGCAYIAPGGKQMTVQKKGNEFYIAIQDGPLVSGHKPSVDMLFNSIAKLNKSNSRAALLTGMGNDGAEGLKSLYDIGVKTAAQDNESSVVWGMPKSAIELEPNHHVLPLKKIAQFLIE